MSSVKRSTPIRSMTGFSRVAFGVLGLEVQVEVRAVNSRFLDVIVKAPRCYAPVEREVRGVFQRHHNRGRIEVSVDRRLVDSGTASETLPPSLDRYAKLYGEACKRYGVPTGSIGAFLGEVLLREYKEDDESSVGEVEVAKLLEAVQEASEALSVMREVEGAGLRRDVHTRLESLTKKTEAIKGLAALAPARLRDRIVEKLKMLEPHLELDPQRLITEVALISERIDTSEELARLRIHLEAFSSTLEGDPSGVGRKLDFLSQEIGRELNTIASKAQDAGIQGLVVEAKTELERIREQVQNIE